MDKRARVFMLPANEKAQIGNICFGYYGLQILEPKNGKTIASIQHLYITSDDEIKEGFTGHAIVTVKDDTRINYIVDVTISEKNQCYCKGDRKFSYEYYNVKPIIATTDSSLKVYYSLIGKTGLSQLREKSLPQPSQSFIQKYVDEYKKGNQIVYVLVEYEKEFYRNPEFYGTGQENSYEYIPKVSKDNTITIRRVKDSWSRDEVVELIKTFRNSIIPVRDEEIKFTNEWIEENL